MIVLDIQFRERNIKFHLIMLTLRKILLICLTLSIVAEINYVKSTHISGTFNTREFFRFLIKFGFQKTDRHRQKDSCGYIFGNVTSRKNFSAPITLAVLNRGHFLEYYGNRTLRDKNAACTLMFNTLNQSSYDVHCNEEGQDFLRYVAPLNYHCLKGKRRYKLVNFFVYKGEYRARRANYVQTKIPYGTL